VSKYKHYLTGIPALNLHHYDWHKCSANYSRQFPDEVKNWCNWGIEDNIANPIRAYLDYLFFNIKFERRVPNMRIDMFLFNDDEAKEIEEKIETMLKPALSNNEELELLELFKNYLHGGKYDFKSKSYTENKAYQRKVQSYLDDRSYFNGSFFKRENSNFTKTNFKNISNANDINSLAMRKLMAIENRTLAKDLYDISFIIAKYSNNLDPKISKAIYYRFKNVDFIKLLVYFKPAFEADKSLNEAELFESIVQIKNWLSEYKAI